MWVQVRIQSNNHFLTKSLYHTDVSVLYSLVDYCNSLWLYPQPSGHHMERIQQSITILQSLVPPGTLAVISPLEPLGWLGQLVWHQEWFSGTLTHALAWWHRPHKILQSGVWLLNPWTSVALALYTCLCTGPTP